MFLLLLTPILMSCCAYSCYDVIVIPLFQKANIEESSEKEKFRLQTERQKLIEEVKSLTLGMERLRTEVGNRDNCHFSVIALVKGHINGLTFVVYLYALR